ncbi:WG repeat-containing protein [Planosporangium flavigriseum]|uniref:WG containing repeat-containing protein n=1 Tax=Planosporangium flavigriseum TaxID=373681 RepID=A0A8J3PKW4_9ACTN|nr:WG repeat-containing protein [Planosporangium flavigriseum]GIG72589.1 hypothetical protein Pfl04_09930 [Planosporangium flavigriseum]
MSDVHPDEEPGTAAPTWASLPTMPWARTKPGNRRNPDLGDSPTPLPPHRRPERPPTPPRPAAVPPGHPGHPGPPPPQFRQPARPAYPPPPGPPRGASPAPRPGYGPLRPGTPLSPPPAAPPVSAPPVSGPPVSAPPVSAPPVSAPPVSAPPVSAPPVSGPPSTSGDPESGALPVLRQSGTDGNGATASAPSGPDAEGILAELRWRFDPDTLREIVDVAEIDELIEVRRLLTAKLARVEDNGRRARLLSLRAVVSRILGDLDEALADGELALTHAEATGELRRIAIAQARLAHVLQWRGEHAAADRLFVLANSTELPDRLRAAIYQQTGKCAYDQGRFIEACNHFEKALELRGEEDPDLIAQTELALDAVFRRVAESDWGPYPRSRDEIVGARTALTAEFDEHTRRWGFADDLGVLRIPPRFTDVQPFRDGVAWVQRPGSRFWELIDESGELQIDHTAGYLGVGNFSDGIAWVSRDGAHGWIAVDKANAVLIPTGYDDVRPFRRGLAPVRRGGRWGAVDSTGRIVVPLRYDGFVTALHDGRYIDGFSDEGLAIVALGHYRGVVDRTGRLIVPPVHPVVVIHPVAFLITDPAQRWGALDRRGRRLLETRFASRTDVTDQLDRLLSDARPIL